MSTLTFQPDNDLYRLATECGTTKGTTYGFTTLYWHYFQRLRHQPLRLLEIGIDSGGSLKMWEQFFEKALIYGIDAGNCSHLDDTRIKTFQGDQADASFLKDTITKTGGCFDIVIDDGGHQMQQQIVSFQTLWPHVVPGGCYVIEDLQTSYYPAEIGYGGGYKSSNTAIEMLKCLIDHLNEEYLNQFGNKISDSFSDITGFGYECKQTPFHNFLESICFHKNIVFVFKQW